MSDPHDQERIDAHARYMAQHRKPLQSLPTARIVGRMSEDDCQALFAWLLHHERDIASPGAYDDFGMLAGVFEAINGRKAGIKAGCGTAPEGISGCT